MEVTPPVLSKERENIWGIYETYGKYVGNLSKIWKICRKFIKNMENGENMWFWHLADHLKNICSEENECGL